MIQLLDWLSKNPSTTGTLASAVIAAAVGLIVFAITQLLTAKRNRAALLVPKLEELYLILNVVAAENAAICIDAFRAMEGDKQAQTKLRDMDHIDLYGHRSAKSIIMYIRLYFPQLEKIHQMMFAAQRNLNQHLFEISNGKMPAMPEMLEAAGLVAHFIKLTEAEIVDNRDALVGDRLWSRSFKNTTDKELHDVASPPGVPMWLDEAHEAPSQNNSPHL